MPDVYVRTCLDAMLLSQSEYSCQTVGKFPEVADTARLIEKISVDRCSELSSAPSIAERLLMIAYIALFSALLSRLTALVCGST